MDRGTDPGKILTNSTGSPISSIIGTPQYASPDQFRLDSKLAKGEFHRIDRIILGWFRDR